MNDIAVQWTAHANRAANVQYMYSVNGGPAQFCGTLVNQQLNGGQFNTVCSIAGLSAGSNLAVILNNAPAGYVIADAVRLSIQ